MKRTLIIIYKGKINKVSNYQFNGYKQHFHCKKIPNAKPKKPEAPAFDWTKLKTKIGKINQEYQYG